MSTISIPFNSAYSNINVMSFTIQMLTCYAENCSDEQWLSCRSSLIDTLETMTSQLENANKVMDQLDSQTAVQ